MNLKKIRIREFASSRRLRKRFQKWVINDKSLIKCNKYFYILDNAVVRKNSLKSIMMIHCQNILGLKRLWIWFRENTFDSHARSRWKRMFKHAMFVNTSKFLVISFMKSWILYLCLKCYEKKISMNFIIGLSSSKRENVVYNIIFVIVDKCTKMIKYLSMIIKINVAKLMKLFFEQIVLRFDMLTDIVNDKNSLFINAFWSALCYHANIKCRLSTVFYS